MPLKTIASYFHPSIIFGKIGITLQFHRLLQDGKIGGILYTLWNRSSDKPFCPIVPALPVIDFIADLLPRCTIPIFPDSLYLKENLLM